MTEDNVIEFCQWLMNEKGIEAGNLSDYINNNEEEVLRLAKEFKKPKFKIGGKIESVAEMFKCGGKAKKKVKKHANGEPITVPVKIDETRTGAVTYNPDGTRKESIRRITEQWQGTASPNEAITHRVVTPDSTAMYVQYGPVDEEMRRGYLYNTARKMGAREKANRAKFDPIFNELGRKADFRITTLPDGKIVINDVVHTDNDTLSRIIDQGDTTIVNSAGDRFRNNSIRTRLARMLFGTSNYDEVNKNFQDIDFQQNGGELLSRKDLKKEAKKNYGYNGKQFRDAYRNSIASYQNKGYKRSKAKEFAQEILTRAQEKPAVTAHVLPDIGSPIIAKISAPSDINMPINKFSTIIAGNFSNTSDYDSMSFNSAFGDARKSGAKTFWWRGKEYGTQLKSNAPVHNVVVDPNNKMIIPNIDYAEIDPMDFDIIPVKRSVQSTNVVKPTQSLGDYNNMIDAVSVTDPSSKPKSNTKVSVPVIFGIPGRFGLYRGMKKGGKIK